MSTKRRYTAINDITDLKVAMAHVQSEIQWLKRIIIGAASLGFIEKAIGWIVK